MIYCSRDLRPHSRTILNLEQHIYHISMETMRTQAGETEKDTLEVHENQLWGIPLGGFSLLLFGLTWSN